MSPEFVPFAHRTDKRTLDHVRKLIAWLKLHYGRHAVSSVKRCQLPGPIADRMHAMYGIHFEVRTNGDFVSLKTGEVLAYVLRLDWVADGPKEEQETRVPAP